MRYFCRAPELCYEEDVDADTPAEAAEKIGESIFNDDCAAQVFPLRVEVQVDETVEAFDVEIEAVPQFIATRRKPKEGGS